MANTTIQLKYSDVTATPLSLNTAEPAYSNVSNKLFIGQSDGSVVAVGGKYYTALIDAATSANTSSAIVKRGSDGGFSATYVAASLYGNANTATVLQNARNFGIDGEDVFATNIGFDGSGAVLLQGNLKTTGVTAGTYGGASQIPVFTVDSKGRLTSASNTGISVPTNLTVAGDTGSGSLALASDTLTIAGRDGLASIFVDANNTVLLDVDNTVVRTTGGTISGDLAVTGNLVVSGNTVTQDVETIVVQDSLVKYANNNTADALDIGFYGTYNDGTQKYTTLFRDASDSGKYKLLTGGTTEPSAANTVDPTTFSTATLVANIEATSVLVKGKNVLDHANGAYDTANSATTTAQAAYNQANTATTTATGAYNHANGAFNTANSATTTAQNAYNLANGTAIVANTDYTTISVTAGDYGSAAIVPVFNLAANGRIASITNTSIAIGASAITSGTLGVARGGTGSSSFTANGVVISGTTTTSALTSVASSTEGHVLQISSSGIPTFAHLNGGSF
jgi:hypothetical protein